jgi:hypothetical protein
MTGTRTVLLLLGGLGVASGCGGAQAQAGSPQGGAPSTGASGVSGGGASAAASPASSPDRWPFGPAPSSEERAAQLARLAKDPGPIKSNWVPPGRSARYGHAEGLVAAPFEAVKARVGDFMHYKELAGPKFKSVKVVAKEGDLTDVYFNLPIMHGLVTLWYVTRFAPPRAGAGGADQVVEGTFVKGNIKDMHIAFTVRHGADDTGTVLVCDLVLGLAIPAPQSAVDEELRDACGDAINSVRKTTAARAPGAAAP